ncbi:ABC transporter ATP-binding protein [Nonomuraea sp. LPB2021202275-12-8]|uniref:ABC transporter ATP-binding protein n=1 Tax=Nonomuraea sp. LPB2021202275-12-8 TaxID=3120159 RepID=UPI00300C5152
MSDVILACENLRKRYGGTEAVSGLGFSIAAGETYGLLGPNGAGKTTAISMIVGVLRRDAGTVTIDGRPHDVDDRPGKALIGYVPQELGLYRELTARENLRFFARLHGMRHRERERRVAEVLEVVGLSDRAGGKVAEYSGGMMRRLNIGIGLLNRPRLLVLDEPTAGVDPHSRNTILDSVRVLADEGVAVLYTTHYMEEAERLCDRVGVIDEGRLRAEGTRRELVALVDEHDRVSLGVDGDPVPAVRALAALPRVRQARGDSGRVELLVDGAARELPAILAAAERAGSAVRSVEVREPDLEAVFLHLTGKGLRD